MLFDEYGLIGVIYLLFLFHYKAKHVKKHFLTRFILMFVVIASVHACTPEDVLQPFVADIRFTSDPNEPYYSSTLSPFNILQSETGHFSLFISDNAQLKSLTYTIRPVGLRLDDFENPDFSSEFLEPYTKYNWYSTETSAVSGSSQDVRWQVVAPSNSQGLYEMKVVVIDENDNVAKTVSYLNIYTNEAVVIENSDVNTAFIGEGADQFLGPEGFNGTVYCNFSIYKVSDQSLFWSVNEIMENGDYDYITTDTFIETGDYIYIAVMTDSSGTERIITELFTVYN